MDGRSFDHVVRTLARGGLPRRRLLTTVLATLSGGAVAGTAHERATAARRPGGCCLYSCVGFVKRRCVKSSDPCPPKAGQCSFSFRCPNNNLICTDCKEFGCI